MLTVDNPDLFNRGKWTRVLMTVDKSGLTTTVSGRPCATTRASSAASGAVASVPSARAAAIASRSHAAPSRPTWSSPIHAPWPSVGVTASPIAASRTGSKLKRPASGRLASTRSGWSWPASALSTESVMPSPASSSSACTMWRLTTMSPKATSAPSTRADSASASE